MNKLSLQAIKPVIKEAIKVKAEGKKEVLDNIEEITEKTITDIEATIKRNIRRYTQRDAFEATTNYLYLWAGERATIIEIVRE